jgi:hypothetical protein
MSERERIARELHAIVVSARRQSASSVSWGAKTVHIYGYLFNIDTDEFTLVVEDMQSQCRVSSMGGEGCGWRTGSVDFEDMRSSLGGVRLIWISEQLQGAG